jgi:hypothetical protein
MMHWFFELNCEQNASTGICCINKFSGGYTPDPHIKGIRVGKGFKRNNKGGQKGSEWKEYGRKQQKGSKSLE